MISFAGNFGDILLLGISLHNVQLFADVISSRLPCLACSQFPQDIIFLNNLTRDMLEVNFNPTRIAIFRLASRLLEVKVCSPAGR